MANRLYAHSVCDTRAPLQLQLPLVALYKCLIHSSRRSGIPSCWTTAVEQLSVQPTVRTCPSPVPPGVKDVWLTDNPAPCDLVFLCAIQMLLLTYLLTYTFYYNKKLVPHCGQFGETHRTTTPNVLSSLAV